MVKYLTVFLVIQSVIANIVNMDNFRLAEKVLQGKSRFVFSDFAEKELQDAKVLFDF